MPPRDPIQLTEPEWALMQSIWQRGQATVREVFEDVAAERDWAYTTVKTMLDRMEQKELLRVRKIGPIKQFSARQPRKKLVPKAVGRFLDRVLDDSLDPLVDYIAKARDLDESDITELRRLLEEKRS